MDVLRQIRWPRIFAESVAIITSILLAFAIDAWWQRRTEVAQAEILKTDLYSDFQASQQELERIRGLYSINQSAAEDLLDRLVAAAVGEQITVSMESVVRSIDSPTYSPTTAALELAFQSGEINLIEDRQLRNLLASWRQLVPDTAEEQILIQQNASNWLIPQLSNQLRLGSSYNSETLSAEPLGNETQTQLRMTTQIEGALAYRVFLGSLVVEDFAKLNDMQAEILRQLEAVK